LEPRQTGWRLAVKRTMDVALSLTLLAGLSPVIAGAACVIRVRMGRPVLFRQQRPGRGGKPFTLVKFRTMASGGGSDAARLTPIGRVLRAASIDELPQLWNVLCGDMSLVGPRPLLMEYLPLYSREQARRHDVLPGITGWAQVNGRNALSHEQRFELDTWYVDHWSLWLDARILGATLLGVLRRSGIAAEGHVTMPAFRGNGTGVSGARVEGSSGTASN
jgi:lipopolysaccharide/colanic/teichoic acid biosynthesis glycosyltransferase